MGDFPDPDEEYELMYADEFEMLREEENASEPNIIKKKPLPAKRSLDFTSPSVKKHIPAVISQVSKETNHIDGINSLPLTQPIEETPVISNKRTVDDLFGDIGDIEDDILLPSKKQKTEDEEDEELITKIIEARRLRQMILEPSKVQGEAKPNYNAKENLSLDIPRWAFMPLTSSDGDRIYVRLESEESWDKSLDTMEGKMSLHATYADTWVEARKILEEKQQQQLAVKSQDEVQVVETDENANLMWVDKFRPQSYVDLLSEEPVNRALLHWLHLWDKIVFKKEYKTKDPQQRTTFSKRAGQFQLTNSWRGKREAEPEVDEDGRPRHKVALLCGPPGVGKTTLAHLLAKLAGYRPVELNASDDRSTEAFRTALHNATLMRSVLDPDRRPNCLILDEIDGAPLATVELLVRWCTAAGGGKKKAKTQPLRRPVIAICNDLYAASLRPLRPVSQILYVTTVSLPRLAVRLSAAAERAGAAVTSRVAAAVAARAHPDVRAALHLLGFLRRQKGAAQVTVTDVEKASIGTKDCHKSLMQGLQAIFTINDKDTNILKTIQAAGEYERLADGIFENYLQARVDSRLAVACETLSWLRLYDTIHAWTMRTQNYSMYGALPLCLARCHAVLASRTPQRIKFPTQAQEMYRRQMELDAIVTSLARGCSAGVAQSPTALRLSLIPLLPCLLSPALRSANVQLCSESERAALRACAGAMCDYGLQYSQQRSADGLYSFVLEPDIYKVAFFGNEEKARPPPAIRQAIAREQQLEAIRRNEEMANRMSGKQSTEGAGRPRPALMQEPPSKDNKPLPNHLQRLQPKLLTKPVPQLAENTYKNFYYPENHDEPSDDDEGTLAFKVKKAISKRPNNSIEDFFEKRKKKKTVKKSSCVSRSNGAQGVAYISTNQDDGAYASHLIKIEIYDVNKIRNIPPTEQWKHADVRVKYYANSEEDLQLQSAKDVVYQITKQLASKSDGVNYVIENDKKLHV